MGIAVFTRKACEPEQPDLPTWCQRYRWDSEKRGIYHHFDCPGVIERFVEVLQDQELNAARCWASIIPGRRTIETPYRLQIFQDREGRKPGVKRLTLHLYTGWWTWHRMLIRMSTSCNSRSSGGSSANRYFFIGLAWLLFENQFLMSVQREFQHLKLVSNSARYDVFNEFGIAVISLHMTIRVLCSFSLTWCLAWPNNMIVVSQ